MKKLISSIVAAATMMFALPAWAVTFTFTNPGDSYNVPLQGFVDGEAIDGLGVLMTFNLVSANDGDFVVDYGAFNTSGGNTLDSLFSGFGFNVASPFVLHILAGPVFDELHTGQISSGITVGACVVSGNSCSGGGNEGLRPGQFTSGRLLFETDAPFLQLSNLTGRLRAIDTVNDGRGLSGVALPEGGFPVAVPEPSTWAMMILGFGAAGAMLRRRRPAMSLARL